MARPQAFDTDEVLHKALEVFWKQGFESASLPDLMAATGLSKSSLYATFGNKLDLFIRAFDRYRADRVREMRFILSRDTGRQAVQNFFCKIIDDASSGVFAFLGPTLALHLPPSPLILAMTWTGRKELRAGRQADGPVTASKVRA